jgi:hypothetical protein
MSFMNAAHILTASSPSPFTVNVDETLEWIPAANITPAFHNCTSGIRWIFVLLDVCVVDTRMLAAVICGFMSIFAWILNGIPQMVENCRYGLPDKAVSPWLLLFLTTGDCFSFIGTILIKALTLQKVMAVYCLISDAILISQFIYFYRKRRREIIMKKQLFINLTLDSEIESTIPSTTSSSTMLMCCGVSCFMFWGSVLHYCQINLFSQSAGQFEWMHTRTIPNNAAFSTGRVLLSAKSNSLPLFMNGQEVFGYCLGIISLHSILSPEFPS